MPDRTTFIQSQTDLLRRCGVGAASEFVDVPAINGRAHVLVAGEGPPLVMVIGGGAPAAMWAPLIPHIDGFTVYAVDRPGFGLTDTVPHTTAGLRSLAVGFLSQVLDGLGLERPVFVANSMGSLWTIWLALDEPDRVEAMTHIGCPAVILGTFAPFPMRLLAVPGLGRLMMGLQPPSPRQADQVFTMMKEDLSEWPELRQLMVACETLPDYAPSWLQLIRAVGTVRGARPEIALTEPELADVTQPVQLIWGNQDPFGRPEVGQRAAEIIPDAEIKVIPGGHTPWLGQAERIGQLATPFLRKHATARDL